MCIAIPRDADQQFHAGKVVEGAPRPGDLLFFGTGGRITHVTLSLGGDDFIHASGNGVGVTFNSFDTKSPMYSERLKNIFVGVRRFV
jgi:cell wall-associated NlpC family hydrolase